jgi:hypothetical protein
MCLSITSYTDCLCYFFSIISFFCMLFCIHLKKIIQTCKHAVLTTKQKLEIVNTCVRACVCVCKIHQQNMVLAKKLSVAFRKYKLINHSVSSESTSNLSEQTATNN